MLTTMRVSLGTALGPGKRAGSCSFGGIASANGVGDALAARVAAGVAATVGDCILARQPGSRMTAATATIVNCKIVFILTWIRLWARRSLHAAVHEKSLCSPQPPDPDCARKSTHWAEQVTASRLPVRKTLD